MSFSPPNNAILAGWTLALGRRNSAITGLHHPNGDLMKYSSGTTIGYTNVENITAEGRLPGDQTSSYWSVQWSQGSTEEGSSGSGLFTYDQSATCPNGCYLFRGSLSQGSAACSNPTGSDRYGRFDLTYPYIANVIDPSGVPTAMNGSIATEYYNVTNDHYFITADPGEAASLDVPTTRVTGWYRTGQQFGVYPAGTIGTAPVCRFFGDLPIGGPNSHFYTADRGECNAVAAVNSGWKLEGADAFRVVLPIGNACPAGTRALYRAYNYHNTPTYRNTLTGRNGYDSNHRYFTDPGYFDIMIEKSTWNLEPSGRVPLMCVR
jgi:lysyl endopeptidase